MLCFLTLTILSAFADDSKPDCVSLIQTNKDMLDRPNQDTLALSDDDPTRSKEEDIYAPNYGLFNDYKNCQSMLQAGNTGSCTTKRFKEIADSYYFYIDHTVNDTIITSVEVENPMTDGTYGTWPLISWETEDASDSSIGHRKSYKVDIDCSKRLMSSSYGEFEMNATVASPDPEIYDCNPVSFFWIAECGDNLIPRNNFNVGWQLNSDEIVKNGEVRSTFKNSKFTVAPETLSDTVYIYMTGDEIDSTARTFIEPPSLNVDYDLVYPIMTGQAVNGGWVDNERFLDLTVTYQCLVNNGKKVPIAIDISIPYFEDVRIVYYKQCGYPKDKTAHSKMFWFMIILLAAGALYGGIVFYNYYFKDESGIDAFPLGHQVMGLIEKIKSKHSGYQPGPFERELPDFDEPSAGPLNQKGNVTTGRQMSDLSPAQSGTTYGSI